MHGIPVWMRKLDAMLEALPPENDPLMLSEIDGFLAGVTVSPEMIPPSEWMPLIWNRAGNEAFAFESEGQLRGITDLVMKFYNSVGRSLRQGEDSYQPIYDMAPDLDQPVCLFWLSGFSLAMQLRPEGWSQILASPDEDAQGALSILLTLINIDDEDLDMADDKRDELLRQSPDLIARCVQTLDDWRRARDSAFAPPAWRVDRPKVGRNDPCPCGSGKKYKKCCGAT